MIMADLDWKSYEELTRHIYESIGSSNGVTVIGYGNNCKYKGKSGVEHQIDVLTRHSDGLHDYLTDIECKYWNQKIDKDIIMKVESIVKDCNFAKGIVVSKCGFTPDATTYANHVGVGLVELREVSDDDLKGRIKKIQININASVPELDSINASVRPCTPNELLTSGFETVKPSAIKIVEPNGVSYSLETFIQEHFFKELKGSQPCTKTIDFPNGTVLKYPNGKEMYIDNYTMSGHLETLKLSTTIEDKNKVLYLMKSEFENKTFLVNEHGEIVKELV